MKTYAFVGAMILGIISILYSQEAENKNIERLSQFFSEKQMQNDAEKGKPVLPEGLMLEDLDESTKEKFFDALKEYFEYRISGYKHRQNVFHWQLYSSKIIFIVVVFLVIAGIYFSGIQFHSSLKLKKLKGSTEENKPTEIVASIKGIKVSSPILGVIILIISLLFFYLYLIHVYPIIEIF
jgi:hypothetical protein